MIHSLLFFFEENLSLVTQLFDGFDNVLRLGSRTFVSDQVSSRKVTRAFCVTAFYTVAEISKRTC